MMIEPLLPSLAFFSLDFVKGAIGILVIFTAIVGIHELGHYLAARWRGMEVEEFAFGIGPRVFSYRNRQDEIISLRWLPLGGFVRVKGMEPKEDGSEMWVERGFYNRGLLSRAIVIAAGPFASIAGGLILAWIGLAAFGQPDIAPEIRVAAVEKGSAAQAAGIQPGDEIILVDGRSPGGPLEFRNAISDSKGRPLRLTILRDGQRMDLEVTPRLKQDVPLFDKEGMPIRDETGEQKKGQDYQLGVRMEAKQIFKPVGFWEAGRLAVRQTTEIIVGTVGVFTKVREIKDNVGGPITIGVISAKAAQTGFASLVLLASIISVSLGLINLLPIPPLDGGQLLIVGVEALRGGQRLSYKAQNAIAFVGFMFVMALILAVFTVDINRWFGQ
jgi:regulator of sigma E protease